MPDDEAALRDEIVALAKIYGRYGYRRVTALLRVAGWCTNHKRVERIWRRERLSCSSSALPWLSVPEDGVEDRQQLPGDRDQGDELRLARIEQAVTELPESRVVARGDHGAEEPWRRGRARRGPSGARRR